MRNQKYWPFALWICLAAPAQAQWSHVPANQTLKSISAPSTVAAAGEPLCAQVNLPDVTYIGATNRCSLFLGPVEEADLRWTQLCYNSDSSFAAIFMPFAIQIRRVGTSWPSWSPPPYSEEPDPVVGFNPDAHLSILLQLDASTAGFELQTNALLLSAVSASFKDVKGNELINITRIIGGSYGARLFAASCSEGVLIDRIDITASDSADGFAIAQIRSNGFITSG